MGTPLKRTSEEKREVQQRSPPPLQIWRPIHIIGLNPVPQHTNSNQTSEDQVEGVNPSEADVIPQTTPPPPPPPPPPPISQACSYRESDGEMETGSTKIQGLTEEQEVDVAEWFKEHPILYDRKLKEYKNSQKKNRILEEKAAALNPPSTCKLKQQYDI